MVLGLSTAQELGLVAVAAAFIGFAVLSAFVLPARDPSYPGRRLGVFVAVTALFFVAMLTAIVVLAREPEEAEGHEATPTGETATQETQTQPQQTQSESQPQQTQPAPQAQGDPAAGKAIFTSAGCSGCHTLSAASATGTVGPNLDQLKPAYDAIVKQVTNGGGAMPAFKGQLSEEDIRNVAAFVFTSTH
ncbi:MAG TPA: cytochrome c [Gaiellaceae bacterium]|nr:cytochrome c [Gaiellaceae bacterium]